MYSQFIKELIDLPDVLIQKVRKEGDRWIFELLYLNNARYVLSA